MNWAPEPYDHAKDSVESIIQRFSRHIIKIKQNIKFRKKICFTPVTVDTVKNINGIPQNKPVSSDIPLNVLISSAFTFSYLTECINEVLRNSKYPESLKLSDIVPVYKKRILQINLIFDQSAFCLLFQRFLKKLYLINYATIFQRFLKKLYLISYATI